MKRWVTRLAELAGRAGEWVVLQEGVDVLRLVGDPQSGPSAALLRYQAGAHVPAHRHPGFEVIYVISGSQSDGRGTYSAGTLVVNHEGMEHNVWSDEGCVVLIFWERPVVFT